MEHRAVELIKYLRSLGLEVNTSTKARGNQGIYFKNRIDISKNIPQERVVPVLLHEFTHYIHSQIEPSIEKSGGTIEKIFDDDRADFYENELLEVTKFVDKSSKCEKLQTHRELIKAKIKDYEEIIKSRYPEFQRSKKFKEFDKYIRKSNARYLLKYDRVKLLDGRKTQLLSIDNIEQDFCDMPKEFAAYIRLRSFQKRQKRVSAKINKLNKYYSKPTELFARFVEGFCIDAAKIKEIAPNCCKRFFYLLECGYYKELAEVLEFIFEKSPV